MHIELLQPHTHAGNRLEAGERLDLDEASARWLIEQGVAKAASDPATPTADSKPARRDATSGVTPMPATQGD